jgi:formamidopyrimidine-DNA glycosylase
MPELPEVETIARSLRNPTDRKFDDTDSMQTRPGIIGRRISGGHIEWPRTIAVPTAPDFLVRIKDQIIEDVTRRGKFLILRLTNGYMLFHLRMSGDIRVEIDQPDTVQKHDRVILFFTDGSRLVFNDPRKFGRIWLENDPQRILENLGPDPFSKGLNPERFLKMLNQRSRSIKPLLMDQSFLAGMGNIYSDEALHLARIHPLQPTNTLDLDRATCLLQSIREVLQEGIRRNGASIDWVYRGGDFQNYFKVYQRTGKPCYTCGESIQRIVVGQRGTHFCPQCQQIS